MKIKNLCLLVVGLHLAESGSAQQVESNSRRELNFVFEVKQIDEFFERFNHVQHSLFADYISSKFPTVKQDRYSMLTTLFNKRTKTLNPEWIADFCSQVTDTTGPAYLDFYGNDWYAEAICKFLLRGEPIEVLLLLKIQQTSNGGSKWMIMGVFSRLLSFNNKSVQFPGKTGCCKFLNPMSHATNFISLSRALSDKVNIPDYLDTGFFRFPSSASFVKELLRDQLKYQYVKEIRYHFLQVDGWIFTVSQFRRQSVNSGWLISSLIKADAEEKRNYRAKLLLTH